MRRLPTLKCALMNMESSHLLRPAPRPYLKSISVRDIKTSSAMPLAPQEIRTFFISFKTWDRRRLLQSDRFCELLLDVLRDYRHQRKFLVHEFVFMPDHVHLILTPEEKVSR